MSKITCSISPFFLSVKIRCLNWMHYFICISLSHQANPINVIQYVYKDRLISEGILKKKKKIKSNKVCCRENQTKYNMPLCLYDDFFGKILLNIANMYLMLWGKLGVCTINLQYEIRIFKRKLVQFFLHQTLSRQNNSV